MTKFKITVWITDSTTEITIDAIQPIQEILMPELPFTAFRRCTRTDDQSHRPDHRPPVTERRAQASSRTRLPAFARPRLIM